MPGPVKASFEKLYGIADQYDGYFTAKHATSAGYSNRMQIYHVQNGDWLRESRGIFRLRHFPLGLHSDLLVWYLWSSDRAGLPQGVISHDTALQVHNLGTWRDSKVHLTVPNRFRRSAMPTQVHLHYENLNPDDVMTKHHFKITKPLKTIVDLLIVGYVSDDYLIEALEEAIDSRQILQADVMDTKLSAAERQMLNRIWSQTKYA
jgi:predicted transcriptional regulator of viral defense system